MSFSRWSIPYGASSPLPFWGPQTSAVNFCEEDYIITHYVAEFFNTLTSLAYIGYGYHGIRRFKRENVSPFSAVNLPYWGLMAIGTFSSLYHSTMKYHTQMSDEMSMHLAMGCALIRVFTFQQPPDIQRRNATIIVVGLTSFITYHCLTDEFALHVILFFSLSVTVIVKTRRIIRLRVTDRAHKRKMSALATTGTGLALFAYFLWNIDVHFCSILTRWKRHLGMPWGIFFELHGWWHVLTAIAAYIFMALIEFLTCPEHDETHGIGFAWPAKAVLQEIVPRKIMEGNGILPDVKAVVNGDIKSSSSKGE